MRLSLQGNKGADHNMTGTRQRFSEARSTLLLSPVARGSSVLIDPDGKEASSSSENSKDY